MIYEFKSLATATIIMTQPIGDIMLDAMSHPKGDKGVITVAQMPDAIKALEALAADNPPPPLEPHAADDAEHVAIANRALPLIEMLKESLAAGKDVTWGV